MDGVGGDEPPTPASGSGARGSGRGRPRGSSRKRSVRADPRVRPARALSAAQRQAAHGRAVADSDAAGAFAFAGDDGGLSFARGTFTLAPHPRRRTLRSSVRPAAAAAAAPSAKRGRFELHDSTTRSGLRAAAAADGDYGDGDGDGDDGDAADDGDVARHLYAGADAPSGVADSASPTLTQTPSAFTGTTLTRALQLGPRLPW